MDPEALARERVESRIRIVELEAEAYEAHAARAAAEGALRSAIEQRESGVAEAEAVALEEARQFVLAEAAAFDERLANAQAMFDTTESGVDGFRGGVSGSFGGGWRCACSRTNEV